MATRIDIRALRDRYGLTQQEIADRMGVGVRSIKRWEGGHVDPSPMALHMIQQWAEQQDRSGRKGSASRQASSPGRASGEDIGKAPPSNESEAPRRRPVVHLPEDHSERLAPLAAVLPSMRGT